MEEKEAIDAVSSLAFVLELPDCFSDRALLGTLCPIGVARIWLGAEELSMLGCMSISR